MKNFKFQMKNEKDKGFTPNEFSIFI